MPVQDAFTVSLISTQKEGFRGAAGDTGQIDVICFVTSYGVKRSQTPPTVQFRLYGWCFSPDRVSGTSLSIPRNPDSCTADMA